MTVQLCYNASENNVINKVISVIDTANCILKNAMSITTPTLILEYDIDMTNINYIFIPETGRYYFITDIIPMTGHRFEVHCKVDVLESFKNSILTLNCIVDKQQNIGNKYFDDGSWKVTSKEFLQTYTFPNGFNENGEFILITCGGA